MNTIRVGIIGAGRIGKIHAESIATRIPNAELAAIATSIFRRPRQRPPVFGRPLPWRITGPSWRIRLLRPLSFLPTFP